MQILLVEDNHDLRRLFARCLSLHGFEVWEAADGLEAMECLGRFRPFAVLTDLMMPNLDGPGLIRRLRMIPGLLGMPILAMSAASSPDIAASAVSAGADAFLAKPLDLDELLRYLARLR